MIDVTAFTAIVREAVGSRSVMYRNGQTHDAEYGALCRVITHLLGYSYESSDWTRNVMGVHEIIDSASPRDYERIGEMHYASALITGALLSLANGANRLAVTYSRESSTARIMRHVADVPDTAVQPTDADWLLACGYVQAEIIAQLTRSGVTE